MRKGQHKDIFEVGILLGQESLIGSSLMESNVLILPFYA